MRIYCHYPSSIILTNIGMIIKCQSNRRTGTSLPQRGLKVKSSRIRIIAPIKYSCFNGVSCHWHGHSSMPFWSCCFQPGDIPWVFHPMRLNAWPSSRRAARHRRPKRQSPCMRGIERRRRSTKSRPAHSWKA
jgi:hypothetical protein